MHAPETSLLGRDVSYPRHYDASLLFPIPRAQGRAALALDGSTLPFVGHDRWHAYELSWLDPHGKPVATTATITVPATSPHLIESKSFKLYLNSLNAHRFASHDAARAQIVADLSQAAGTEVGFTFGLPPLADADANPADGVDMIDIDACAVEIDCYGPPAPSLLQADAGVQVEQRLCSQLLKSNCPVTGQPDWASVHVHCRGPRIDPASLLRYLVSFRDHADFHEQCVERVFTDLWQRCQPEWLSVEARYTRRGGLDINPWRASPGRPVPAAWRDPRQ